jgi:F-type H+-transporting ATPase subunit alpha
VTNGYLDDIETGAVREFEDQFYRFLDAEHSELMSQLATGAWDDDIIESLRSAADDFKQSFTA